MELLSATVGRFVLTILRKVLGIHKLFIILRIVKSLPSNVLTIIIDISYGISAVQILLDLLGGHIRYRRNFLITFICVLALPLRPMLVDFLCMLENIILLFSRIIEIGNGGVEPFLVKEISVGGEVRQYGLCLGVKSAFLLGNGREPIGYSRVVSVFIRPLQTRKTGLIVGHKVVAVFVPRVKSVNDTARVCAGFIALDLVNQAQLFRRLCIKVFLCSSSREAVFVVVLRNYVGIARELRSQRGFFLLFLLRRALFFLFFDRVDEFSHFNLRLSF